MRRPFRRRRRRRGIGAAIRTGRGATGAIIVCGVMVLAVVGPWVAPHPPTEFIGPPFAPPGAGFPLGTDVLGRDALSRVLDGGRTILLLSAAATAVGVTLGAVLGITAGYRKGIWDEFIMRLADVGLAFPQIVLALLLVSIFGPQLWLICTAVALVHTPQVARVVRSATLRVVEEDYVRYAESIRVPPWKITVSEILPNIWGPVLVEAGLRLPYSVAIIAGMSFLGFGLQPPAADWGLMINENRLGLASNPWPVVVPVLLIAVLTIGMNLVTDAISRKIVGVDRDAAFTDALMTDVQVEQ